MSKFWKALWKLSFAANLLGLLYFLPRTDWSNADQVVKFACQPILMILSLFMLWEPQTKRRDHEPSDESPVGLR